uniref:Transposase n=1 Tax=Peronospora matthiolae TaxID=2874970 RepID=A0AAV1T649_9STRA
MLTSLTPEGERVDCPMWRPDAAKVEKVRGNVEAARERPSVKILYVALGHESWLT